LFSSIRYRILASYEFSEDESKILLATGIEPIVAFYLRDFFVYDLNQKQSRKISNSKIQEPCYHRKVK